MLVSPDLVLVNRSEGLRVRGRLAVPGARIVLEDLPPGSRDVSSDVVVLSGDDTVREAGPLDLDLEVEVEGKDIQFTGFGLNVEAGGRVLVTQEKGREPTGSGELKIISGSYRAYGQDLSLDNGRISWAGGLLDNPGLHLRASRRVDDVVVGLRVTGTARKPQLAAYSSDPAISEKDALSMLLTGQKTDNLAEASIYAGKQITPDLSVGVNLGRGEAGTEFVTRYRLRDKIYLEGTSSAGKSGGRILYSFEIE